MAPRLGEEQTKETYHSSLILSLFFKFRKSGSKNFIFFCNWPIVTKQDANVCLIHMRTRERNDEITRQWISTLTLDALTQIDGASR